MKMALFKSTLIAAGFVAMAASGVVVPRAYASAADDQFAAALRTVSDGELLDYFKKNTDNFYTLMEARRIEMGEGSIRNSTLVDEARGGYDDAMLKYGSWGYWKFRGDVPWGRSECGRFVETDYQVNQKLAEQMQDLIDNQGERYLMWLRDTAWIEDLDFLARAMDAYVADGKTGGEIPCPFGPDYDLPEDDTRTCPLPSCFKTMEKQWRDWHAERATAREVAVDAVIGSAGVWSNGNKLKALEDESGKHHVEDASIYYGGKALEIGVDALFFFLGYGEAKALWGASRWTLGGTGAAQIAIHDLIHWSSTATKSLKGMNWNSLLVQAKKLYDTDWPQTQDLVDTESDVVRSRGPDFAEQLKLPGVVKLLDDVRQAFHGDEVYAYNTFYPVVITKVRMAGVEIKRRGLSIPADEGDVDEVLSHVQKAAYRTPKK